MFLTAYKGGPLFVKTSFRKHTEGVRDASGRFYKGYAGTGHIGRPRGLRSRDKAHVKTFYYGRMLNSS
jgi:hypothetical protein